MREIMSGSINRICRSFSLLLVTLILVMGCESSSRLRIIQVEIDGEEDGWFGPISQWGLFFGPTEEGGPTQLIQRGDGEFLLPVGDASLFLSILPSDGSILRFGLEEPVLTLAGNPAALFLTHDDGWEWLGHATPEEKASLRAVVVDDELSPDRISLLEDLAAHNPTLDVGTQDGETVSTLLSLFDPGTATLGDAELEARHKVLLSEEGRLKTFMVSGDDLTGMDFLATLPKLETLFVDHWDADEHGTFPSGLPSLKTLVLSDPSIDDLTSLGPQPDLKELVLFSCHVDDESGLLDISALGQFPKLEVLAFRDCDVKDLSHIGELKELEWLGLAWEASQDQLRQIVSLQPDLAVLELFGDEELTDLTPLTELKKLRALMVGSGAPIDPLLEMDQLEYLGVLVDGADGESYEPEVLPILQAALPETVVSVVAPFCLGSGLIFLLLPLVGLGVLILRRRTKFRTPVPPHV
jgi:hypothetical protein